MSFRQKLFDTGHPEAGQLADAIIFGCKSTPTINRYKSVANRFQKYRAEVLSPTADLDAAIAAFILDCHATSAPSSRLAKAALLWHYDVQGISPNPAASPIVSMAVDSVARSAPAPIHRAKAPPALVRSIVEHAEASKGLNDVKFSVFAVLAFAGFYRPVEALKLKIADLSFTTEGLRAEVRRSKRNQVGPPEVVWIARGAQSGFCPVEYVRKWSQSNQHGQSPWLFPALRAQTHWSYNALRSHIKQKIAQGILPSTFSAHSFRGGAATAAAEQGIPIDAIARAGRWNNTSSTEPYIKRSRKVLQGADSLLSRLW